MILGCSSRGCRSRSARRRHRQSCDRLQVRAVDQPVFVMAWPWRSFRCWRIHRGESNTHASIAGLERSRRNKLSAKAYVRQQCAAAGTAPGVTRTTATSCSLWPITRLRLCQCALGQPGSRTHDDSAQGTVAVHVNILPSKGVAVAIADALVFGPRRLGQMTTPWPTQVLISVLPLLSVQVIVTVTSKGMLPSPRSLPGPAASIASVPGTGDVSSTVVSPHPHGGPRRHRRRRR